MSSERYLMGIDGGGSSIRVVITTFALEVVSESRGETANPSAIGRERAAARIRAAMHAAMQNAGITSEQIGAVGIGVAGAAASHSEAWLREVVAGVVSGARVAASADYEIALVGSRGERKGVLVLAGTGSLAYGVNDAGESALVGGWGYLLGDEGSGYWLGLEGLRAVARAADGQGEATSLSHTLLAALGVGQAREIIRWLYGGEQAKTREVAELVPLVLGSAEGGDAIAQDIVRRGADALASSAEAVMQRLRIQTTDYAFAGGMLQTDNPLSEALCQRLGLSERPVASYSPVMGAAILARDSIQI
jgi:glucosamine kinase